MIETKMMPITTYSKVGLIAGMFPKKYPANRKRVIQITPPMMLNDRKRG